MLTDAKIRAAKPQAAGYRMLDGEGLFLFVHPTGKKTWRYRYARDKRERVLTLGHYPGLSLSDARKIRDGHKLVLNRGEDPVEFARSEEAKAKAKSVDTFELIAREWHAQRLPTWAPVHATRVLKSLEEDIFPELGDCPITSITSPALLSALRKVEARGAVETARRIRQRVSEVFVYAIASGRAETDPAAIIVKAMAPTQKSRMPAFTSIKQVREILAAVEAIPASPVTKLAHRLLALTAVRPGVIAALPWSEVNNIEGQEQPTWLITSERMKLRKQFKGDETRDHLVPLSRQAVEVISVMRQLTGRGPYVFPNQRHAHKPMGENALVYLLHRAGFHSKHVPHGWRAAFSSIMNERCPADAQVIEMALAHVPKDKVAAAYNRALYLDRRRALLQEWADEILSGLGSAECLLSGPRK